MGHRLTCSYETHISDERYLDAQEALREAAISASKVSIQRDNGPMILVTLKEGDELLKLAISEKYGYMDCNYYIQISKESALAKFIISNRDSIFPGTVWESDGAESEILNIDYNFYPNEEKLVSNG